MRYIVQVRRGERWASIGHPQHDKEKAFEKLEAVLDSGCYDRVKLVVVDPAERAAEVLA